MDSDDEHAFAFQESDCLPSEVSAPENPIPYTEVNSQPLEFTSYVSPYLPCRPEVLDVAVRAAEFSDSDILVDLGSGDGRVLLAALRIHPTLKKCVGVELDPYLVEHSSKALKEAGHEGRAEIVKQDLFAFDLAAAEATVLIAYLLPPALDKLKPSLIGWLGEEGKNRRLLTINYKVPGWTADRVVLANFIGAVEPIPINIYVNAGSV
eukprot:comp5573_c0_seq1/m.1489 comp5573_c0_seq1/g.1489  ORF comp5573_c0_seq1/g.1489 comp5573_c0_seq1/m.1489 type:complete len:208 (-) comp5573_c0_seq1:212-835(-)